MSSPRLGCFVFCAPAVNEKPFTGLTLLLKIKSSGKLKNKSALKISTFFPERILLSAKYVVKSTATSSRHLLYVLPKTPKI
jgi:hypothetical protein